MQPFRFLPFDLGARIRFQFFRPWNRLIDGRIESHDPRDLTICYCCRRCSRFLPFSLFPKFLLRFSLSPLPQWYSKRQVPTRREVRHNRALRIEAILGRMRL